MCAVLEISPKTYYKYRNKEDPDYYDYLIIKEVFDDSKGTYGYRRIVEGLKIKYGVVMNVKKVLRIMKKYNLVAEYIRKTNNHVLYRVTPIYENENLLASGIQMEGLSIEDNGKGIKFNIFVYNVQPGIKIDYKTGKSTLVTN